MRSDAPEERELGFYMGATLLGLGCLVAVVFGLPLLADVEFAALVFERLSIRKVTGDWLDFWRWFLGIVSAVATVYALHRIDLDTTYPRLVQFPIAVICGLGLTVAATVATFFIAMILFFVLGLVSMFFAGPF